jgi:ParB/RepB/Spo0J family partition protein
MPIIGQDKEATEKHLKEKQAKYDAIKQKVDEIRATLLKEKDLPLDKRTEIPFNVPIDFLCTYPGLERQYSEGYIKDLAEEISKFGIIHKIVCTINFNNNLPLTRYEPQLYINAFIYVVCGNGRISAKRQLGHLTVDILIKYMTPDEVFAMSLSENDSRDELNPIDRASQFKNWMETTNITQSQIAEKRNKTQPWVSLHLKLLTFPDEIQKLIREKKVSLNRSNKLFQIDDKDAQKKLAGLCASEKGLSEKEFDDRIQQLNKSNHIDNTKRHTSPVPPLSLIPDELPETQLSSIDDALNKAFEITNKSPISLPETAVRQKLPEPQLSPSETIAHYVSDSIYKALEKTDDNTELLFKSNLKALYCQYKDCKGNCRYCEHFEHCKEIENFFRVHCHYPIPEIPFNY